MKPKVTPHQLDRKNLEKLPPESLVQIVLALQELVLQQQATIEKRNYSGVTIDKSQKTCIHEQKIVFEENSGCY